MAGVWSTLKMQGRLMTEGKHDRELNRFLFKSSYDTHEDFPIDDFLVPALRNSSRYNRAGGFFSSAIISVLAEAFTDFAESGGKMNLICSPVLSFSDAHVFQSMSETQLVTSLNASLNHLLDDGVVNEPLNLMAALIHHGCLTVKFAIPFEAGSGMFHQKIGLFTDFAGNRVAFNGSNNETISGWVEMKNAESFSVYTSWRDDNDLERLEDIERRINRMWLNQYRGFDILDFSDSLSFIENRATDDLAGIKQSAREWYLARRSNRDGEKSGGLYQYQKDVLHDWKKHEYKGIVCFATGAGKTRTAISAIDSWRETLDKRSAIVLVPTERLQDQWLKEFRKNPGTKNVNFLLAGGDSPAERWQKALHDFTEYKRHNDDGIVIAVNRTASQEAFYKRVNWGGHLLLVADEVHNLGAPGFSELLGEIDVGAVMGLSATPNRYNDDENVRVREVFGEDLKPIVDIPYAQSLGVLVPYRYRFQTVGLSEFEAEEYVRLSRKIGQAYSESTEKGQPESRLQILTAQRANILKNAESKTYASVALIKREFKSGESWLVFCNDTAQLNLLKRELDDLHPLDFHGGMDGDSGETLRYFGRHGGVLLSIHMLDEGIDIPSIDHCLLIASSQNKRQFIQRRGRVLRVDRKNVKGMAEIWDLIVVDSEGKAFVPAEVTRAIEFGSMAINSNITYELDKLRPSPAIIK